MKTNMNKTDKFFVALLLAALAAYMGWSYLNPPPPAPKSNVAMTTQNNVATQKNATETVSTQTVQQTVPSISRPKIVEKTVQLSDNEVTLTISNVNGAIVDAELLNFKAKNTEDSKNMKLPLLNLLAISDHSEEWFFSETTQSNVTLSTTLANGSVLSRSITLLPGYKIAVNDKLDKPAAYSISAGVLPLENAKDSILSIDTLAVGDKKPIIRETTLTEIFGVDAGGCSGAPNAQGLPEKATQLLNNPQTWVALKSRFFIAAVMPAKAATSATLTVARNPAEPKLVISDVSSTLAFAESTENSSLLYIGPKKYELLRDFGNQLDDVMDFGFFSWFCKILLPTLNFFHTLIPNYGIAIILLTLLVRVVFWPLTHKSTVSMKKMQVIQPELKRIQAEFKGNPQKIQQETMKLYRDNKVNPLSGCLPMLIQIPIFIALYTILRSAVELRFASFLWVSDLSQPENIMVAGVAINILPILMALTMGLQSHFTPQAGDPAQKKMMTWMMPIMMLFMFYTMPSALCLYWTVSQLLSIVQMIYIQKTTKNASVARA